MQALFRLTAPGPVRLLLSEQCLRLLLYLQLPTSIRKHLHFRPIKVFQGILSYERNQGQVRILLLLLLVLMSLVGEDAIDV